MPLLEIPSTCDGRFFARVYIERGIHARKESDSLSIRPTAAVYPWNTRSCFARMKPGKLAKTLAFAAEVRGRSWWISETSGADDEKSLLEPAVDREGNAVVLGWSQRRRTCCESRGSEISDTQMNARSRSRSTNFYLDVELMVLQSNH